MKKPLVVLSEAKDPLSSAATGKQIPRSAQDDSRVCAQDDRRVSAQDDSAPPHAQDDMTRRDVLKLAAVTPLAAVAASPETERLERFLAALAEAEQRQGYTPKFFTAKEWRTVRVLADYVIPRDDRSGSATDAKAPEYMDFVLQDELTSENNRIAMRGGLAWLDNECRARFDGKTFVQATDAQRRQVLDDIAFPRKAKPEHAHGVTFFNRFRDMTAAGFFSSAMGWRDLQYIGNVFNPGWNGCGDAANTKLGVSHDIMKTFVRPENDK
jgi:gluconate 2-dehydrogenase gamma chain